MCASGPLADWRGSSARNLRSSNQYELGSRQRRDNNSAERSVSALLSKKTKTKTTIFNIQFSSAARRCRYIAFSLNNLQLQLNPYTATTISNKNRSQSSEEEIETRKWKKSRRRLLILSELFGARQRMCLKREFWNSSRMIVNSSTNKSQLVSERVCAWVYTCVCAYNLHILANE